MVKYFYGAIALLFLLSILSSGGNAGSMIFTLLLVAAGVYVMLKASRKIFYNNDEKEYEQETYSSSSQTVSPNYSQNSSNGVLTQTEEEVWKSLTGDMTDETFDPPIPLEWSTLNPFRPYDKKAPKKPKVKDRKY